jgi:hypothetical protein
VADDEGNTSSDDDSATVAVEPASAPSESMVYPPIVLNASAPPAPDLVVESIIVTSAACRPSSRTRAMYLCYPPRRSGWTCTSTPILCQGASTKPGAMGAASRVASGA